MVTDYVWTRGAIEPPGKMLNAGRHEIILLPEIETPDARRRLSALGVIELGNSDATGTYAVI